MKKAKKVSKAKAKKQTITKGAKATKKAKTKKAKTKKAKAKKVKKAKAKKAAPQVGKAEIAIAAGADLGCCTIVFTNQPSVSVPHVTRRACIQMARARGGVGQWNAGECA